MLAVNKKNYAIGSGIDFAKERERERKIDIESEKEWERYGDQNSVLDLLSNHHIDKKIMYALSQREREKERKRKNETGRTSGREREK